MERLTEKHWRNLDPWECCGQDYYCKRGCHDEGGCTKGCIVPRIYARLAAYEDAMPIERAQELAQAEKDGRLVVLPYKIGDLVYQIAVRGKYLNHSMETPYIKTVEIKPENAHKYITEIGKTVFLTCQEAEAALKKREEADNETD